MFQKRNHSKGFNIELAEDELVYAIRVRVLLDTPQWLILSGERLQMHIVGGDSTYKGAVAIYKKMNFKLGSKANMLKEVISHRAEKKQEATRVIMFIMHFVADNACVNNVKPEGTRGMVVRIVELKIVDPETNAPLSSKQRGDSGFVVIKHERLPALRSKAHTSRT